MTARIVQCFSFGVYLGVVVSALAPPASVFADDGEVITVSAITPKIELPKESDHPLKWTLRYADAHLQYINRTVRDYSCRLIKRERIDGKLQSHQFIQLKVRSRQQDGDRVVKPFAVFMRYLAPANIRDRRVLFVENEHGNRVLVRKGGFMMRNLRVTIDPNGRPAKRESNYPITDVGFDKIIQRLVDRVRADIDLDPSGDNTKVTHYKNAKLDGRSCTHIRVVHPRPVEGMTFYSASLYVDDELHVPTRLLVYGWPEEEAGEKKPPLEEEYTYVNLKINAGLTDDDFSESLLDDGPDRDNEKGGQAKSEGKSSEEDEAPQADDDA